MPHLADLMLVFHFCEHAVEQRNLREKGKGEGSAHVNGAIGCP